MVVPPRQGSILPLGGVDNGHKGYGLALMVEALTAGLANHGRIDPGPRWGATLFVQVIDPTAFCGRAALETRMDWIVGACEASPPADPAKRVRLPGHRGLALREQQLRDGVRLKPPVVDALQALAVRLGVTWPSPLAG